MPRIDDAWKSDWDELTRAEQCTLAVGLHGEQSLQADKDIQAKATPVIHFYRTDHLAA